MEAILDFDTYYINMLPGIAAKSKDPNTKIGCIIIGSDNEPLSMGYNSFPRGINDNVPDRYERPEKYLWIEHAERNAIYNAARSGIKLKGSKIYLPCLPCMDCARAIVQVGIVEVIYDDVCQKAWEKTSVKYAPEWKRTRVLFAEAGVRLRKWTKNKLQ